MKKFTLILVFIFCFSLLIKADWLLIPSGVNGDIDGIHFLNSQNGYCSGGFNAFLSTSNGGSSWTVGNTAGIRDFGFYNDTYGYGAGPVGNSMYKTIDGGVSWSPITPPTSNSLWAVASTSSSTAYFVGTGGVLWKTINSGGIFTIENSGTTELLTDIVFTNPTTGYIVVQTGEIRKSINGGPWNVIDTVHKLLTEMYFVDENIGYVVGSSGLVLKTIDAGATWSKLTTNSTTYLQGVNFFDSDHGIVVGTTGTILYTDDGGINWYPQNSGTTEHIRDVWMLSPTSAVVTGDNGVILKNTNITIGIDEQLLSSYISFYPNPIVDKLIITSAININCIEVFDAIGKLVLSIDADKKDFQIDFSNMKSGIYVVSLNTKEGKLNHKIIK